MKRNVRMGSEEGDIRRERDRWMGGEKGEGKGRVKSMRRVRKG